MVRKKKLGKKVGKAAGGKYAQVAVETFDVADLEAAPYNPRVITDAALHGLSQSLQQFGLVHLPVVNRRADGTLRIVGGHQRVRALKEKGVEALQCIVVQLSDEKEIRANLTLNNAAIEGDFVPTLTRELINQLNELVGDESLVTKLRLDLLQRNVSRALESVQGVDDEVRSGKHDEDDVTGLGKTAAVSKPGRLYGLGDHTLFCGRLVKPGSLDAFGETVAEMAFSRFGTKGEFSEAYLDTYLRQLLNNTVGGIYLATTGEHLARLQDSFIGCGGYWSNTLIGHYTRKGTPTVPYQEVSIPILYGWRDGSARTFYGDRTQSNVWLLKRTPPRDDVPVEAVVRHLLNSSKRDSVVLDVQANTGTTVVACEKTKRRLIGYVSNARDMDRVRRRWTRFTYGPKADWKAKTKEL